MATDAEVIAAEADLPIGEFFARGNARDRGEEVEPLEAPAAETTETTDATAEPAPAADGKTEPPKIDKRTREGRKASIQQEIDALTTKRHDTNREYEQAQTQLGTLRAEIAALEAKKTAPEPKAEPVAASSVSRYQWDAYAAMSDAPQREQFPSDETYGAAVWMFIADKRVDERLEKERYAAHEETIREKHQARVEAARKADPDFDSKLVLTTPSTRQMRDFIARSEMGPAMLVYLSQHQDIARRLSTLPPQFAAEELGRIEVRLEAAPRITTGPAPTAIVSAAKPPLKPVSGSPNISADGDSEEDLPVGEFFRRGNARDRKAGRL